MSNEYALAIAASEIGVGTRQIEKMCNEQVYRNADGLRVISGETLRQLIIERDERLAQKWAVEAAKRAAPQTHETRERVRQLQAQQKRQRDDGADADVSALAVVMRDHYEARLDQAGERWDSYRQQERG